MLKIIKEASSYPIFDDDHQYSCLKLSIL